MGERNNQRKRGSLDAQCLASSPPFRLTHPDQLEFRSINAAQFAVSRQLQTPSLRIPFTHPANASGTPATTSRSKIFRSVKSRYAEALKPDSTVFLFFVALSRLCQR
jgi:hypothetical protein